MSCYYSAYSPYTGKSNNSLNHSREKKVKWQKTHIRKQRHWRSHSDFIITWFFHSAILNYPVKHNLLLCCFACFFYPLHQLCLTYSLWARLGPQSCLIQPIGHPMGMALNIALAPCSQISGPVGSPVGWMTARYARSHQRVRPSHGWIRHASMHPQPASCMVPHHSPRLQGWTGWPPLHWPTFTFFIAMALPSTMQILYLFCISYMSFIPAGGNWGVHYMWKIHTSMGLDKWQQGSGGSINCHRSESHNPDTAPPTHCHPPRNCQIPKPVRSPLARRYGLVN